jgi:hypothetical protein
MTTQRQASDLLMRWVPVTDASGRTHMEAVWVAPKPARPQVQPATSHAA